jgi:DNA-binding beta-propeller fold protein YncE
MKRRLAIPLAFAAVLAGGAVKIVQDQCGPFTDVTPGFCPYVLELYYLGITAGTSATTYSPDDPLTRGQAAVFVSKGLNQSLARSSRRAALGQWWTTTPHWDIDLATTTVGPQPIGVQSDGADLWVASAGSGTVSRVRASDGRLLETWTGAAGAHAVLVAMGRVFVAGGDATGKLFMIDPTQNPGAVTAAADLGAFPHDLAFDGSRIWATSLDTLGNASVSIVTPGSSLPWSVTTVTGFVAPRGLIWDGSAIWVADLQQVEKLDATGAVMQTVPLDNPGQYPTFDGANIWVPSSDGVSSNVTVIRAATGAIVATLSPIDIGDSLLSVAAFDGTRVAVADVGKARLELWKAGDLSPIGSFPAAIGPEFTGVCSDGLNFWITLNTLSGQLARF